MKFFLIRHSCLTIVQAKTESEALEHYGCKQKGHSVEWRSSCSLELPEPIEIETDEHWDGWWKAVKIFRVKLGLE